MPTYSGLLPKSAPPERPKARVEHRVERTTCTCSQASEGENRENVNRFRRAQFSDKRPPIGILFRLWRSTSRAAFTERQCSHTLGLCSEQRFRQTERGVRVECGAAWIEERAHGISAMHQGWAEGMPSAHLDYARGERLRCACLSLESTSHRASQGLCIRGNQVELLCKSTRSSIPCRCRIESQIQGPNPWGTLYPGSPKSLPGALAGKAF